MKRSIVLSCILLLASIIGAGTFCLQHVQAQGRGGSGELNSPARTRAEAGLFL